MRYCISYGILTACLWLSACANPVNLATPPPSEPPAIACRAGESLQVYNRLYFGTRRPGGAVSNAEWEDFLREVITPRFPEGLTVLTGRGQWQTTTGHIVRERSYVLTVVYPERAEKETAVAEVIQAYKNQFNQESVLRIRSQACVSFD
ncbi:DUF3574 domain-containing protein [Microbulbifer celer]|uniref:DUF3574 domain-containing protein n=1 Tax=Microbulbifer celer TaxID=435905 RepID=A0ABW3U7P6_9GAMM|nr:DUF3574 domain-containing protein [Microbulbifer celer]